MPLQNRVDPWGQLNAVNAKGAWLGNRGILHNDLKEIVAPWRHKSWVTCELAYKDRKRTIFSSGSYSELFFLDEATALSAGHRPCAECRRARYVEFKDQWIKANADPSDIKVPVSTIDKQLHSERAVRGGKKLTYSGEFKSLPSGAFIERDGIACLYWQGRLLKWSPSGYVEDYSLPHQDELVTILTPQSIVWMFQNGFTPQVHESAGG